MKRAALRTALLLTPFLIGTSVPYSTEEFTFDSGPFKIAGELRLPSIPGPHPVIIFVHGDGPNDRTSGVTYPPIMERMLHAGFATCAWDKPGTGESTGRIDRSRLLEQRSQIVLDSIAMLKKRHDIDTQMIGLWGISQAGYVMPYVLTRSDDIAFMIAVSCPGEAGVDQGAYLVARQAVCVGLPEEDAEEVEHLLASADRARTYEEYASCKKRLAAYPALKTLETIGLKMKTRTKEEWEPDNLEGRYYWNPMEVIKKTAIPVLAFFGEKDTQADPVQGVQAYKEALRRAGNTHFRVELISGVDHNLLITKTGCIEERENRTVEEWRNYSPLYLDILESWLKDLRR